VNIPPALRVRSSLWVVLALAVLLLGAVEAAVRNVDRMHAYWRSGCEYSPDYIGNFFTPTDPDPDGVARTRWPDGSLQVTDPRSQLWQMYDARGVLRVECQLEDGRFAGTCRYFDAGGRLRAEGRQNATGNRVGVWTVYDVVGDGARWIWFWE